MAVNEEGESYGNFWERWLDKFEDETLEDLKNDVKKFAVILGLYGIGLVTYGVALFKIFS